MMRAPELVLDDGPLVTKLDRAGGVAVRAAHQVSDGARTIGGRQTVPLVGVAAGADQAPYEPVVGAVAPVVGAPLPHRQHEVVRAGHSLDRGVGAPAQVPVEGPVQGGRGGRAQR